MGLFFLKMLLGGLDGLKVVGAALKRFFGALNVQGWLGLLAAAALAFMWLHSAGEARHWQKQSTRYERLYNGELAKEKIAAKQALALKTRLDAAGVEIARKNRELNDEQNRRIAASADAVRLHGPGKAACPGNPGSPAAAGRPEPGSGAGNVAVDPVPDRAGVVLIAVPFDDSVTWGADHDGARAENIAWHQWYRDLVAAWGAAK